MFHEGSSSYLIADQIFLALQLLIQQSGVVFTSAVEERLLACVSTLQVQTQRIHDQCTDHTPCVLSIWPHGFEYSRASAG